MTNIDYNKLKFSEYSDVFSITPGLISKFINKNIFNRILDLGCGTGVNLLNIAKIANNVNCVGLDVSEINIKFALNNADNQHLGDKVSFVQADFLQYKDQPFNLIYAESVLHLINCSDHDLFKNISDHLKDQGLLIVTMPDDCFYNKILVQVRKILRKCRNPFLDSAILHFGKFTYPSISIDILKDRLEYMYMLPARVNSLQLRKQLEDGYGLKVMENSRCVSSSLAKLKHNLVVFKKGV